jgi:PadR family transcriptional regulator
MESRFNLGTFDLMILLALMRLGDAAYGVPISREIEETSGRVVALATLYATLTRLEKKGLVSSRLGEPTAERGGRAKRYFRVTAKGLREVRDAQRVFRSLWNGLRGASAAMFQRLVLEAGADGRCC